MKQRLLSRLKFEFRLPRSGVSLIEVIVSMLIMSIGIVLVATLLPVSILRTAQATQLTHAVFLRNNAEALLVSNPSILNSSQPQLQTPSAPTTFTGDPNTYTNTNNQITRAVIDPLGFFLNNATPGSTSPSFWLSSQINPVSSTYPFLPRLSAGTVNRSGAAALAQLPDSWTQVIEGAATYTPGSPPIISIPSAPSLNVFNAASSPSGPNAHYRMVLFDSVGKNPIIKPLLQATGTNFSWWDVNATTGVSLTTGSLLTGTYVPVAPATSTPIRARIDVLDRRFTWLMTVEKKGTFASWTADVDVAVIFNRAFNATDEFAYPTTFALTNKGFDGAPGVRNVDDDNDGTVDNPTELNWRGSDDNRTVVVDWTSTAPQKPFLKKGGFLLETNNLVWYRVLDIQYPSSTTALLSLDQDVKYDESITLKNASGVITLAGVFMKGVVDVYPLNTIAGQQ